MNARLETLFRSGLFFKFLQQMIEGAGRGHTIGSEQDKLRNTLREELRRIESGDPALAVADLLNIARVTRSSHAYLLLAAANMKANEWENALTILDILQCIEPNMPEANLLKGFVLGYFNRFDAGKKCLRATVDQVPSLRLAWMALIEMAMAEGSNHEAARFLTEALRVDPHNIEVLRSQLGLLLDPPAPLPHEHLSRSFPIEVLI